MLPTFQIQSLPNERKYCYSSWGYNLIGCVASTVTGKSLSRLISEYVLNPLEMNKTTFDYHIASTYPMSLPHSLDRDGNLQVLHYQRVNTVYHAGAGLYSNTADMCKLMRFFLNNGRSNSGEVLLTRNSLEEMLYKHIEKSNDPGNYYGLGVSIRKYAERFLYGHAGNYHPYNSSVYFDQKTGCGIVTMFNSHATDLRFTITEMIIDMIE